MPQNKLPELDTRFLDAIRESYAQYLEHGARSSKKLRPLHQWVSDEMTRALGHGYVIQSIRKDGSGREESIGGKYYDKKVDISIANKSERHLAIISVKFITSNFQQNANNYFEHLMGETANIRRSGVGFGHFMVLPDILPYLNKAGEITRCEAVKTEHLQKYVKLAEDNEFPHRPDVIGIVMVSLPIEGSQNDEVNLPDVNKISVDQNIKDALSGKFSISSFINGMEELVRKNND